MRYVFPMIPAGAGSLWFLAGISAFLLTLVALFGYVAWSSRRTEFALTPNGLRLRGDVYVRFVPAGMLVSREARAVDLRIERELYPVRRRLGTGLPGFAAGWFRLRNGEKALVYVTDRARVVYLPTRAGYSLLLSVAQPEEFVRRLREVFGP